MKTITITVSDNEKKIIEAYAADHGLSVSDILKNAFFDMVNTESDIKAIIEHSMDEVKD